MKKDLGDAPLTLGGWLILIAVRLIGGLLVIVSPIMPASSFNLNATGQIIRIALLLFIVYALAVSALFLKRHKAFPRAYIILEAVSIILNISTFITNTNVRDAFSISYFAALLLISILWISYILLSERVKKTFVYRWNEKPEQRLVDKANGR